MILLKDFSADEFFEKLQMKAVSDIQSTQKFFQLPEEKACEYYDRFAAE